MSLSQSRLKIKDPFKLSNTITYKTCGTITQYSSQGLSSFLFSPQTPTTTASARTVAPSAMRAAAASHGTTSVLAFKAARAPNSTKIAPNSTKCTKICACPYRGYTELWKTVQTQTHFSLAFCLFQSICLLGRIILVLPPTIPKQKISNNYLPTILWSGFKSVFLFIN